MKLLDIKHLKTHYRTQRGPVRAVDGVSFTLDQGENLGLVGESGCGKTTVAKSILRLLPPDSVEHGGSILFQGRELLSMPVPKLNRMRWEEISMISQSAMNALDPVYRAVDQIVEAIQIHRDLSYQEACARAEELFGMVGLERNRLRAYPHELSGGMKQRVVIAMAMALDPALIIADEPTTALDVVVQDGILVQLRRLQEQMETSMIMVTHDISVVSETCQMVVVMYGGRVMEYGETRKVLTAPVHPYTMGLKNAFPSLEEATGELISIPGSPPDLVSPPEGCRFCNRCPFAGDRCRSSRPEGIEVSPGHFAYCHYTDRAQEYRESAREVGLWQDFGRDDAENTRFFMPSGPKREAGSPQKDRNPVLKVEDVSRQFPMKRGFKDILLRRPPDRLRAVDRVSLAVRDAEILGLAGESGSGKSTLGEVICRLQPADGGRIQYRDQDLSSLGGRELKRFRREFQMIFQDPYETLNPRFTVLNTMLEPLKIHGIGDSENERLDMVREALSRSELIPPDSFFFKYPHQLSGGQRQRIALARAIVLNPEFIIADEPVSMLDVSIRAGVLNLLRSFRDELGISIIYISHDLATIRYICDRTAVLYLGRIMELGSTEEVITSPRHPYTRLLLRAVPRVGGGRKPVDVEGEIPDAVDPPNGCRFHGRCCEARAACGWEGRDLKRLVLKERDRRLMGDAAENWTDAIQDITLQGIDLEIRTAAEKLEEVRNGIISLIRREREVMLSALSGTVEGESRLVFSFEHREVPELEEAGSGHLTACPYS